MAARMAMIATTIISSMSVKPFCIFMVYPLGLLVDFHVPRCAVAPRPVVCRAAVHVQGGLSQDACQHAACGSKRPKGGLHHVTRFVCEAGHMARMRHNETCGVLRRIRGRMD